jgi:hypothetical protein
MAGRVTLFGRETAEAAARDAVRNMVVGRPVIQYYYLVAAKDADRLPF